MPSEFYSQLLSKTIPIVFEDNSLIAVDKPCGVLSQGDHSHNPTMADAIKEYIKTAYRKPGNVFLGTVHRLDKPVSGLIVYAKTSKAAGRLSEQIRNRQLKKIYLAVVEGVPENIGPFVDVIGKGKNHRVEINPAYGGHRAELDFKVIESGRHYSKIEIAMITGRKHQIRVQFSSRGNPIRGDIKYGAKPPDQMVSGEQRICLHAHILKFEHPVSKERLTLKTGAPDFWNEFSG